MSYPLTQIQYKTERDIRFHDRTNYNDFAMMLISDYVILYGQIKNLAIKHLEEVGHNQSNLFIKELEDMLNTKQAKSRKRGAIIKDNISKIILRLISTKIS
jgi:hypothetical protein